jgi:hypothetical protein
MYVVCEPVDLERMVAKAKEVNPDLFRQAVEVERRPVTAN